MAGRATEIPSASTMLGQKKSRVQSAPWCLSWLTAASAETPANRRCTHFSSFANLIPLVVMGSRKNQSNPGKYLYIWKGKFALVGGSSHTDSNRACHCHPCNISAVGCVLSNKSMFLVAPFSPSCFRLVLWACSGASSLGAHMVRVSRHRAAAGKSSCKGAFITSPATSNTHPACLLSSEPACSQAGWERWPHQAELTWGSGQVKGAALQGLWPGKLSIAMALLTAHRLSSHNRDHSAQGGLSAAEGKADSPPPCIYFSLWSQFIFFYQTPQMTGGAYCTGLLRSCLKHEPLQVPGATIPAAPRSEQSATSLWKANF